jgi:hypothetical protein
MRLAGRFDRVERTMGNTRCVSHGSLVAQREVRFRICRGYHTGDLGLADSGWDVTRKQIRTKACTGAAGPCGIQWRHHSGRPVMPGRSGIVPIFEDG